MDRFFIDKYQAWMERITALHMILFLVLGSLIFWSIPQGQMLQNLSQELGIDVQPRAFSVLCFVCILLAMILTLAPRYIAMSVGARRRLYLACPTPFLLYILPVAWMSIRSGTISTGTLFYVGIYFCFLIIAFSVYRE